jgi:voltage-gated potassium channel
MRTVKSQKDLLKQKIYIIIYGSSTFWGRLFDLTLLLVILLSVVLVMMESVDRFDQKHHLLLNYGEWIITIFFTIEYLLRIYCNKKPWNYIFSFYGIIDLVSVLPMYLSFFIPGSSFLVTFRALRLLRLFSILDSMPILGQQTHIKEALKASKNKILVFVYFITVVSIVLGTIMFLIEGKESGFTDIPTSIYWCIVTMTTVGYGDIAPQTPLGQFLAALIMIMGYGIIAVPTGIVTAEYSRIKDNAPQPIKSCPNCSQFTFDESDNFCKNCGTSLQ